MKLKFKKNVELNKRVKIVLLTLIMITALIGIIYNLLPTSIDGIRLPEPDKIGNMPLDLALKSASITDNIEYHELTVSEISQFMWAVQGKTHGPMFKTVPSAGASYPLTIILLHKGNQLKKGTYQYHSSAHALEVRKPVNQQLVNSSLGNEKDKKAVTQANSIFIIMARYSNTTNKYGTRGMQFVHQEVGHALQNFILQAASLNLSVRPVIFFSEKKIKAALDSELMPLAIVAVGKKKYQLRAGIRSNSGLHNKKTTQMTLERAMVKRKSTRDYLKGELPLSQVLKILGKSTQLSRLDGDDSKLNRDVVIGNVSGINPGIYRYDQYAADKLQLRINGDKRVQLRKAGNAQKMLEPAQIDIGITIDMDRIRQKKNQDLHYRVAIFRVGMAAQNIYLHCASQGLGTLCVGDFNDERAISALRLSKSNHPITLMPVGLRPGFYGKKTDGIEFTFIGAILGLIIFLLFYVSLYLSLPKIKRRLSSPRFYHGLLGSITMIAVLIHFTLMHGQTKALIDFIRLDSYYRAVLFFVASFVKIIETGEIRHNLGHLLANLAFLGFLKCTITGFLVIFKKIKYKKTIRSVHKWSQYLAMFFMLAHGVLNSTLIAGYLPVFIWINMLLVTMYVFFKMAPRVLDFRDAKVPIQNSLA